MLRSRHAGYGNSAGLQHSLECYRRVLGGVIDGNLFVIGLLVQGD